MVAILTIQAAFRTKNTILSLKTRIYAIFGHFRARIEEMSTIRHVYQLQFFFGGLFERNKVVLTRVLNHVSSSRRRKTLIVDFLNPYKNAIEKWYP